MYRAAKSIRHFAPSDPGPSSLVRSPSFLRARLLSNSAGATRLKQSPPRSRPSFPCVEQHTARESRILQADPLRTSGKQSDSGPEPAYSRPKPTEYHLFHYPESFPVIYSSESLPSFDIAYETWGTLNAAKDNAILLHTGLSASSHAASNSLNPSEGWWEKFIGPGKALDTDQFFIVCTNVLGGCYGSTGPSSIDPRTKTHYGTTFPVLSIFDMVNAQFKLLDHLGIRKLNASVGCSLGGMQSLAAAFLHPERVGKVVSISGTARTSPSSVAMRFAQRSGESLRSFLVSCLTFCPVLMSDPNWKNGFYYDGLPPHVGMKLARRKAFQIYLLPLD